MVKLSRFAHTYDLGDAIGLCHSLRLKPVYLDKGVYAKLNKWLVAPQGVPEQDISKEIDELFKYKILTKSEDEDAKVLEFVRSKGPKPGISVCYMILSESCNLACKYCFLGNNDKKKRHDFLAKKNMDKETADKGIDFFLKQIKLSGVGVENSKPVFIFYGGEPLVNYPVLEYIASKINSMRDSEPYLKNAELSVITNGLLLDESKILRLRELGVNIGISIDGFSAKSNAMRVDSNGNEIFNEILNTLNICKKLNVPVSLSVTITEETLKDPDAILRLIDEYGVRGFGFNIMMSSGEFDVSDTYSKEAAKFIIDEFKKLRQKGVYEDRMMRKLKAFAEAKVYFSDCAATAGGQIVIAPDGGVGICHGCIYDRKYFVSNVDDEDFNAKENPEYQKWASLSPVNKNECLDCPALGICGGGCPVNAMNSKRGNTIESIDERFCEHSKSALEFLISDLYSIVRENETAR